MVIYKYPLEITDYQCIPLPQGAKILSVKVQNETIVLYALVDEFNKSFANVPFLMRGTGHYIDMDDNCYTFLDTCLLSNDRLVLHIFVNNNYFDKSMTVK